MFGFNKKAKPGWVKVQRVLTIAQREVGRFESMESFNISTHRERRYWPDSNSFTRAELNELHAKITHALMQG